MNELYNDVSNGSHTTTYMYISVIDKSYLYTLINNNLYEFDYEDNIIKIEIILCVYIYLNPSSIPETT